MTVAGTRRHEAAGKHHARTRFGPWAFGILALFAVVVAVLRAGEFTRFVELARSARPAWLLLAAALQVLTYVPAALVWHAALASVGARRPLSTLVPLGIAKLFTDQALPSGGISGTLLVLSGLARRGIPAPLAMSTLLVGLVSFYAAYAIAAAAGLIVLQLHHQIGPALVAVAALFAVFVIGVPAAVLCLRRLPDGAWSRRVRRLPGAAVILEAIAAAPAEPLRDLVLMAWTTALQLAIFLLDAATLYVMLRALNQAASPLAAFASFMIADVVATVGPIPLGLGVFEGVSVTVLNLTGTSIEAALAATLLLRGFTFWLPMLPGLWLAHRELRGAVADGRWR